MQPTTQRDSIAMQLTAGYLIRSLSTTGILLGTFFLALSLTPSLLPRPAFFQGLVSGLSFAAGYGIGVGGVRFWRYLELPRLSGRPLIIFQAITGTLFLAVAGISFWYAGDWQQEVRELMQLEAEHRMRPWFTGLIALLTFLATLLVFRIFHWVYRKIKFRFQRFLPRRVSVAAGFLGAFLVFWALVDGLLLTIILRSADSAYQQVDAYMDAEFEQPSDPMRTGSSASLLNWEDMGFQGRRFLHETPDAGSIAALSGQPALSPIRVYAGMNASDDVQERARLALQELIRLDAFSRKILVIVTPTGTGWVDPHSIAPLEYLHHGDVASVALQYSYLPSFLSLLVDREPGEEVARALFQKIYGYWSALDPGQRPRLYLHGLSLGALNSDRSFDLFDIIHDPFHGVFWSGPPFRSQTWFSVTQQRETDSPFWKPRFREGSVVRFANQNGGLEDAAFDAEWGPFRMAFLQYASDPVVFFSPGFLFREPVWLQSPRGPDVSESLRWYPVVTMLQLLADMAAGTAPRGFGHQYAADHYFDSWLALTGDAGRTADELDALRAYFRSWRDISGRP